jgi:hypothetical protein
LLYQTRDETSSGHWILGTQSANSTFRRSSIATQRQHWSRESFLVWDGPTGRFPSAPGRRGLAFRCLGPTATRAAWTVAILPGTRVMWIGRHCEPIWPAGSGILSYVWRMKRPSRSRAVLASPRLAFASKETGDNLSCRCCKTWLSKSQAGDGSIRTKLRMSWYRKKRSRRPYRLALLLLVTELHEQKGRNSPNQEHPLLESSTLTRAAIDSAE